MLFRPMKAVVCEDSFLSSLQYPLWVSPKIDGIRCVVTDSGAVTNTLKPIPNRYIRDILSSPNLIGFDGELCLKGTGHLFSEISSAIMTKEGNPDFVFKVFDDFSHPDIPFVSRHQNLLTRPLKNPHIQYLPQIKVDTQEDLIEFENKSLQEGYEGIMIRAPEGKYKYGRSTLKEQWLLKRKPFVDEEALLIGLEEGTYNINETETDLRGLVKRSSKKEGKIPSNTLGRMVLRSTRWGDFKVGTGTLSESQALDIWENPHKYLGKIVTFKYQHYGSQDKPRIPVFKGFRDPDDFDYV